MGNPLFDSLNQQLELLKTGQISSLALTRQDIQRIERHNPAYNIVIRKDFKRALETAARLDDEFKRTGKIRGPLHGIPFTLKDAFRVKGFHTSFGWPGVQLLPAFSNATLVQRLVDAGAVFLGQTNVPFSCFDWQSRSPLYGLTKNPLDPEYTVGGSSGGSAASLAAHFTPFEIGSDVAGSIRYPAHCCGVFGLRPTHSLVPLYDFGPELNKKPFPDFVVAGPMARTIEDLQTVFHVLTAGPDTSTRKTSLKIAHTLSWNGISTDQSSTRELTAFVQRLKAAGHDVSAIKPDIDFERALYHWGVILGYEVKRKLPWILRLRPLIDIGNYFGNTRVFKNGRLKKYLKAGVLAGRAKYEEALSEAEALRAAAANEFSGFDLWLTPVAVGAAIKHMKTGDDVLHEGKRIPYTEFLGNFLIPPTVLHHPVLCAPVGRADSGLPVGVQLHGKFGGDWQLLADALLLKEQFRPPPYLRGDE